MEQSTQNDLAIEAHETTGPSAARTVSREIMRALELQQLVPGQRLVETELAAQFGVGRNAVREAIQWLAAHGVMDTTRYRSAVIRQLDLAETMEVLDVAEAVIGLMARTAVLHYQPEAHQVLIEAALSELEQANDEETPGAFSRGRRHFYRALLEIGGNRELQRLFPALSLHMVYAQYRSAGLRRLGLADYREIATAIQNKDSAIAERAGRKHIGNVRKAIAEQHR